MDEQELNLEDLDLEDIIREFSDPDGESVTEAEPELPAEEAAEEAQEEAPEEETPEENCGQETPGVTGDTIRMDVLRKEILEKTKAPDVRGAQPVAEEEPHEESAEPFSDQWEPEYEQPMGEYIPPQPIVFRPRSRLRELKRQLVEGPEKQYYAMIDKGLGKLQVAIFISVLVVLLSAGATVLYALGMVQENRMRLMVFGQFFAMLVSALLGSFQLIDGVSDLCKKHFSKNTMLVFTFLACVVDGVFCLRELRVPCCAAFSLEMTMSLWSTYQQRSTKIGQLDSMRKATRLDSLGAKEDYYDGKPGLLRGEGRVEDFMDTYEAEPKPEKALDLYTLIALGISVVIAAVSGVLHCVSAAFQVLAASMLAAVPATIFIAVSRPFAVLERKLHTLGTVLCGWQGVEGLRRKQSFPLRHEDLFPAGSVKMNGVKFYGEREPDEIIAYCTAVITASGCGLAPLFEQVLDSRNGAHYDAAEIEFYEKNAVGGVVQGETVLIGSLQTLHELGVDVPEGLRVSQAVCVAIESELCGLFALSYDKTTSSAAGLSTLCSYRGLNPLIVCNDVLLDEEFIRKKFGVRTRRVLLPPFEERIGLEEQTLPEENRALLLVTREGLAPYAYGVTGARSLYAASRLGTGIHITGGALGLAIMLALTILGALELVTPINMFLYQLVWMVPGILITEWTRTI